MRNSGSSANIHNISTDLETPPQFIAAIKERGSNSNPLDYSGDIASIQRQFFPDVAPINSDKSQQQAFEHAISTAKNLGWRVYASDAAQGRIEAVDTTLWFGFKDDIVIRIQGLENGSRVDLRSVSRVGRSDLGANAKRILKFTEAFNQ
jgi:uncharacterized protein (DUF1499 family)